MGQSAEQCRATYADYAAVPQTERAEIIDGKLCVFPRPAPRQILVAVELIEQLVGPFHHARGGPGGWWILPEPEIHFMQDEPVLPDLAGWRRERIPTLPKENYFRLVPDWVCEVVRPSTEDHDRNQKMPLYARHGVTWAWLIDPIARTLEVYVLGADGRWELRSVYQDAARVRAVPFDAIEIDLSVLWTA
jgi:Uma2 family endonuclease